MNIDIGKKKMHTVNLSTYNHCFEYGYVNKRKKRRKRGKKNLRNKGKKIVFISIIYT